MAKRYSMIIGGVVLALLWLEAQADRRQLRGEIQRVYLGDVTVQTIDAETKDPLTITFHGPTMTIAQRWPKGFSTLATGDISEINVRWVDVGDMDVAVSSGGYEPVPLKLNAATARELVIPLRRSGHTD
jgi:hypothetical protein